MNEKFKKKIKKPIIIPYNKKNKLIKDYELKEIVGRFGIKLEVVDIDLYRQAFTHKSYIKKEFYNNNYEEMKKAKTEMGDVLDLQDESNERLEYLGDTVIKAVIAEYLFERYPHEDEGFMTCLKTKVENRESLARFARIFGLDEFVIISSQNELQSVSRTNDKILEDIFESFIGALLLDTNFNTCRQLIRNMLENQVEWSRLLYKDNNYKDQLQRYYHSIKWEHPKFKLIQEEILPNNKKLFTIGVMDDKDHVLETATESSKKKAEQKVCKIVLYKFGQINDFQMEDNDFSYIN